VDDRTLRGLQSRNHVDPAMNADGGAKGTHVLRNIPQHAMSRILSSPRLSEIRVQGFVAHTRVLRAGGCAVPPCAGNADQNTVLAARGRRALAHRLATHESFTKDRCGFRLTAPRFLLEDCDAWTLNALLTTSSSYRKCSKRRTLGRSAQATSLLPIDGTMKCSHIAHGLGFGSILASAAEQSPRHSG